MAQRVEGDLYKDLDGQLLEIKRQIRQANGYPFDAELLRNHLQRAIEGRFTDLLPFPAEGVEFELTLDGDATDPLQMVRDDGYDLTGRKFNGPKVVDKRTGRYKLLRAGNQPDLDGVKKELGPLAEGEVREAFRRKFRPAPHALVGFGGSEWTNPDGIRSFPYLGGLGGAWHSSFGYAERDLHDRWLWLVPSK